MLTLPNLPLRNEILRQALFGAGLFPDRDALIPLTRTIETDQKLPRDIREISALYGVMDLVGLLRSEASAYGQQIESGQ